MTARTLFQAMDKTWPPHSVRPAGPWSVREGKGAGYRVSSAVLSEVGPAGSAIDAIADVDAAHRALGQKPIFRVLAEDDPAIDAALAARGYQPAEPSVLRRADIAALAAEPPERMTTFPLWPPLAITLDVWSEGGIGAERLAIMARAPGPKTTILGRSEDRAAGAVFAAVADQTLVIHALWVGEDRRQRGLAPNLLRAAARWGADEGARQVALVVTKANAAANRLYDRLGFERAGTYHYRVGT